MPATEQRVLRAERRPRKEQRSDADPALAEPGLHVGEVETPEPGEVFVEAHRLQVLWAQCGEVPRPLAQGGRVMGPEFLEADGPHRGVAAGGPQQRREPREEA